MAQLPYLPLYAHDWRGDTAHLTLAEEGVYFRLLHTMWVTPYCRVPDDNGWLMRHMRLTKDEVRDLLRPIIEEFCKIEDGHIVQRRLQREFVKSAKRSKEQSELAKRRWERKKLLSPGSTWRPVPTKPNQ